uniref:C2H2-type domain-containing protein n=1 Tax=Glossina brevipalpis TaxID=37001 RepID=A0A1A9WFC9_9MUSC
MNCVLCWSVCVLYENLYDDRGESNSVYDMTVKYFDPMLLISTSSALTEKKLKVICNKCWHHIATFHEFQQTILKAQLINEQTKQKIKTKQDTDTDDSKKAIKSNVVNDIYVGALRTHISEDEIENDLDQRSNSTDCISGDDDDKPLAHFIDRKHKKSTKWSLRHSIGDDPMLEKATRCAKQTKSATNKPKERVHTQSSCSKTKSNFTKTKSTKIVKDPSKVAYNSVEKTRELDAFIAQYRPELECDICNAVLSNFDCLRAHFSSEHKTRCYVKCCGRKMFRRYVFAEHLRLHINPDLFKCDICGRASKSKHNLILHKHLVHNESKQQYECEVCHRMFNQKPTLTRHMAVHATGNKDYVCSECGKGYVLEIQLQSHIRTVHNVDRICDQCGKILHGASALRRHLREHAGIKKPKWPCNQCGTELMSHNGLKRHKLAFHHDGSTAYVCKDCGKVAASANALLLHKKNVHEAPRKFKCTYCDKAFKKNKVLQEHIATHTGQDLYECPHCPQTFKVSANMHHHRKKAHPIEWAEARQNRLQLPKVNLNAVTKEVVM